VQTIRSAKHHDRISLFDVTMNGEKLCSDLQPNRLLPEEGSNGRAEETPTKRREIRALRDKELRSNGTRKNARHRMVPNWQSLVERCQFGP
jgi:hypothetical protein